MCTEKRRRESKIVYYGVTLLTFQPKFEKIKEIHLQKYYLNFKKWNFLALRFLKIYVFSKECFSHISGNEILHYLAQALENKKKRPENISYTLGNGNSKRVLTFSFSQEKAFLMFQEIHF